MNKLNLHLTDAERNALAIGISIGIAVTHIAWGAFIVAMRYFL